MKTKKLKLLLLLPLLLTQCYERYLQNGVIYSPIPDDPIVVSKGRKAGDLLVNLDFNYSAKETFKADNEKHAKVNAYGVTQIDTIIDTIWHSNGYDLETSYSLDNNTYDFSGQNILWYLPTVSLGLSLEYDISKSFFFLGSFDWAQVEGDPLFNFSFGFGSARENEAIGFQTSFILGIQQLKYRAEILHGSSDYLTISIEDDDQIVQSLYTNLNMTFNTIKELLYLNYLLNIGFSQYKYLNTEHQSVDSYMHYLVVTPGLFKDFGDNRILAGCKIDIPVNLLENHQLTNKSSYALPKIFLQYTYAIKTLELRKR